MTGWPFAPAGAPFFPFESRYAMHRPRPFSSYLLGLGLAGLLLALPGCAVVAVADAAVTVVATGVKIGAKTVGAGADAVIPGD